MKKIRNALTGVILLSLLSMGVFAQADGLPGFERRVCPEGISIWLPSNWSAVPNEVVENVRAGLSEEQRAQCPWLAAFSINREEPLSFPLITVEINHIGRLPENQLAKAERVWWENPLTGTLLSGVMDTNNPVAGLLTHTGSSFEWFSVGQRAVFSVYTEDEDGLQTVKMKVIRLTETGVIVAAAQFFREQRAEYARQCAEILSTLVIPPQMEYSMNEMIYTREYYRLRLPDAADRAEKTASEFASWFGPVCAMLVGALSMRIGKKVRARRNATK